MFFDLMLALSIASPKDWRIQDEYTWVLEHRWLLKYTKIFLFILVSRSTILWAKTLSLLPCLITLFEAEQAVQMYICREPAWRVKSEVESLARRLGVPNSSPPLFLFNLKNRFCNPLFSESGGADSNRTIFPCTNERFTEYMDTNSLWAAMPLTCLKS